MSLVVRRVVVDCHDPRLLARFWSAALGRPAQAGGEGCQVSLPAEAQPSVIFFREVPESKQVKNRMHLDLNPGGGTLAEEVVRLIKLGATVMEEHSRGRGLGLGWVVMADPEGNEFCVESSDAEVARVAEQLDAGDPVTLEGSYFDGRDVAVDGESLVFVGVESGGHGV